MSKVCGYKKTTTGHPCGNMVKAHEDHCRAGHPCPIIWIGAGPEVVGMKASLLAEMLGVETEALLADPHAAPLLHGANSTTTLNAKAAESSAKQHAGNKKNTATSQKQVAMDSPTPKTKLTQKQLVEIALIEAGYPKAKVTGSDDDPQIALSPDEISGPGGEGGVSSFDCWKIFHSVDPDGTPCFPCWQNDRGDACIGGYCFSAELDAP